MELHASREARLRFRLEDFHLLRHRDPAPPRLRGRPHPRQKAERGPGGLAPRPAAREGLAASRHGPHQRDLPLPRRALPRVPETLGHPGGALLSAGGAGTGEGGGGAGAARGGLPSSGRPGEGRRRGLPGGRGPGDLPPGAGAPGGPDPVARQPQPRLRAGAASLRRRRAGAGDRLPGAHGGLPPVLRVPASLRPRRSEPGGHAPLPRPGLSRLPLRPARIHLEAVGPPAGEVQAPSPSPVGPGLDPGGGDAPGRRGKGAADVAGPGIRRHALRGGAVLRRPGLDAPAGPPGQEHPRLDGAALPEARAMDPAAGPDSRGGAGSDPAEGLLGPLAHRALGAQRRVGRHQADAGKPGGGGLRLLSPGVRRRLGPGGRAGAPGAEGPGLGPGDPAGQRHGPEPHGDRLALGGGASRLVPLPGPEPVSVLFLQRAGPLPGPAGGDLHRGPLLQRDRRRGGLQAAGSLDRRRALRLPRQRRHPDPLERHRAAQLPQSGGPGGGDRGDPPGGAAVPGDPVRRRHDPGQAALPAPLVPGAGDRRRHPLPRGVRPHPGPARRPDAPGVLAGRGGPGRRWRRPTPSCWPRRSG